MFDYNVASEKKFSELVGDLKKTLSEVKFGVLFELDMANKLKEKGVDYNGSVYILEVCNPQRAKEALEAEKKIAYFLPCKIVIYVEGEYTRIGMVRPSAFTEILGHKEMTDFALEVENLLISVIDRVK